MNPIQIIQKYYQKDSRLYYILTEHSKAVAKKSLEIAKKASHLSPDLQFIEEASILHDIGIFLTNAPEINCLGEKPYICHGYLGREILEKEGFPKYGLVCERHTGISIEDIEKQKLPIPKRDMLPVSIEEEIICLADKFFSKKERCLAKEKSINEIKSDLIRFGEDPIKRLDSWLKKFGIEK
ncbi:MAG: HD domain-containing protein [Candidatus Parcubacteria bacterium]|nr:HD domain-containing protein [Candidatus Parcubacteria bacterium]